MTQPPTGGQPGDVPVAPASGAPTGADQPGPGSAPAGSSDAAQAPPASADGFGEGAGETSTPPGDQGEAAVSDASSEAPPLTVEELLLSLEQVTADRDGYLDSLARLQAEFENYRKAVAKRESDARERANEGLVSVLLPVLDACDGAVTNGAADVEPVRQALVDALAKQGLARLEPTDEPFDPEQHEAVMHDEGTGSGPMVAEVLRVGYQWKGRTLRAAMVRVAG